MKLSQEENEIIDYVENPTTKSVSNVKDEISKYTALAQEYTTKKKLLVYDCPKVIFIY